MVGASPLLVQSVVVVLVVGASFLVAWFILSGAGLPAGVRRFRRGGLARFAAENGLRFHAGKMMTITVPVPRGADAWDVLVGPWKGMDAAAYSSVTLLGRFSRAAARIPGEPAPSMWIAPGRFGLLSRGHRAVQVDDRAFCHAFHVTALDSDAARRLLRPRTIHWLLEQRGQKVAFEVAGRWVVAKRTGGQTVTPFTAQEASRLLDRVTEFARVLVGDSLLSRETGRD